MARVKVHGAATKALVQRALASFSGQDWNNPELSENDREAVEMTVMLMVALAERRDPDFMRAVEAFGRGGGCKEAG